MRWIKDNEFIRGDIPMTKFEIRLISVGLLGIEPGDVLLDIGAGTGSVSIEASLQGAEVYSIEKEPEGIDLIQKNAAKFNTNITVIQDIAPEGIDKVPSFNKCFIGGSGGNLKDIFLKADSKLKSGGTLVGNFITFDNFNVLKQCMNKNDYKDVEVRLIQSSKVEGKAGMLKANNPIFIIKGEKP
ncbi:precorrin-6Y C5,15-methyltransferase (decarboxylating) subunit CbiT [Clostridium polyendosporum]|uniref:Precorrin-6Y C5,15-methyltransferase (Decarboxylating) subunit CbiT n=1 Tax=Clostridium polyendosporum TaxID=69208 RepID=A0A919VL32_9CLOT|nr:precorrin-6Y C5,15-methyltransferase (decarboxylating) subunit CbiT [Clostridium polyendosporum]GIM28188.1 precorrin-6Y C5,15-methyltransferase (decarboxylating) subunit CbiT [Clostridium polyendosporum]